MKFLLYSILCLISLTIHSQINTICIYQISPIEQNYNITNADDDVTKNTKKMLLNAFDIAKDLDYVLKFNSMESSSQIDESLVNEGIKNNYLYPVAKSLIGKGIYYQNRKEKIVLRQAEILGPLFIIKDVLINNWKITNEQKKIGDYLCFKAFKNCETCSKIEEVWFTPDIPVPFGPLGYGGLPGLIVEIKNKGSILKLKEIKYIKKELKIVRPIKGKEITIDEYNEMTNGFRTNAKKMSN